MLVAAVVAMIADLRVAVRSLAKRPTFTIVAILALALGIGANSAIFSVVDAVLLRPLPFKDPARLVVVAELDEDGDPHGASGPDIGAWKQAQSFTGVAAYRGMSFNVVADEGPVRLEGAVVTRDLLGLLGVRPLLGRLLDEHPSSGPQVVLAESLWRNRYHGDPQILGRAVSLNSVSYVVVGVVGDGQALPTDAALWASPRFSVPEHPVRSTVDMSTDKGSHYLSAVARLGPGTSVAQAQAEMTELAKRFFAGGVVDFDRARVRPLRDELVGENAPQLLILFGAVGLILLIACANVAHLLMARALARRHEIAIRMALGASRMRLVRLFLAESVVLAVIGGGLGLLGAMWGAPPLAALAPADLRSVAVTLDARVIAFTAAVAGLTAIVFGVLPALTAGAPAKNLSEAGRGATEGQAGVRLRSVLIGLEIALSLVLLVGASLLVRSLAALEDVDPGFGARTALSADIWLPSARYPDEPARSRFYHDVLVRLGSSSAIEAAGAVSRLPLAPGGSSRTIDIIGGSVEGFDADLAIITPGYLAALRVPLRAGRDFTEADGRDAPLTVLVNEAFAQKAWPGQDPLGKRVKANHAGGLARTDTDGSSEVVGVVRDVHRHGLDQAPRPELYEAATVEPWPFSTFVVRGRVAPAALAAELRAAVAAVDGSVALSNVLTMDQRIDASLRGRRFAVGLLGALAGLALVLALVGIYGVIAYSVTQRTRELGIRLALGARPRALLGLVVAQSLRPVVAGVFVGLGLAVAATRLLASLLYGVSATDALTFVGVPAALLLAAAAAGVIAALRSTRVDPLTALRASD